MWPATVPDSLDVKKHDPAKQPPADPQTLDVTQASRRQIRSSELFGDQREVLIEHAGEIYSLRHTSKGKLILTK